MAQDPPGWYYVGNGLSMDSCGTSPATSGPTSTRRSTTPNERGYSQFDVMTRS